MKKLLLLSCLLISVFANAQDFEGKVVYDIKLPATLDPQMKMMMPKEAVGYFKDGKVRMETQAAMGMTTTSIANSKSGESVVLMNVMGSKYAIKGSGDDKEEKEMMERTEVKFSDSTKTVAGYTCKKALVTFTTKETNEKVNMNLWYTQDIKASNKHISGPMGKIDGFILEYSFSQQGIDMLFSASAVTKQPVEESLFTVPADYKFMTQEELKKAFGGR